MLKVALPRTRPELLPMPLLLVFCPGTAATTAWRVPVVCSVAFAGRIIVNLQLTLLGVEAPPRFDAAGSAVMPFLSVGQVTVAE